MQMKKIRLNFLNISSNKKDKKINVIISDNGFGIPDDIKPYVFDRFYKFSK